MSRHGLELVIGLADPADIHVRSFAGHVNLCAADHAPIGVSVVDISGARGDGTHAILHSTFNRKIETCRFVVAVSAEYGDEPAVLLTDGRSGGDLSRAASLVYSALAAEKLPVRCIRGDAGPAIGSAMHAASVLNVPCIGIVLVISDTHPPVPVEVALAGALVALAAREIGRPGSDARRWAWANPFAENFVPYSHGLVKPRARDQLARVQIEFVLLALISVAVWVTGRYFVW